MFMGLSRWLVFGDSMQAEKSLQSRTAWGSFVKSRGLANHGLGLRFALKTR
jgi:hypothetical protein